MEEEELQNSIETYQLQVSVELTLYSNLLIHNDKFIQVYKFWIEQVFG